MDPYRVAALVPTTPPVKASLGKRAGVTLLAVARVLGIMVLSVVFFPGLLVGLFVLGAERRWKKDVERKAKPSRWSWPF